LTTSTLDMLYVLLNIKMSRCSWLFVTLKLNDYCEYNISSAELEGP